MSTKKTLFERLFWWWPAGKAPEITVKDLGDLLENADQSPQILDVRTRKEFFRGHIPGAINVPLLDLKSGFNDNEFDKSKPVIAICLSAHRSVAAVRFLKELGYQDACQLAGGMKAWRAASMKEISVY